MAFRGAGTSGFYLLRLRGVMVHQGRTTCNSVLQDINSHLFDILPKVFHTRQDKFLSDLLSFEVENPLADTYCKATFFFSHLKNRKNIHLTGACSLLVTTGLCTKSRPSKFTLFIYLSYGRSSHSTLLTKVSFNI